jgi:protoheme IX farnesyltransferase
MSRVLKQGFDLFKLRIGLMIAFTALVGAAVTPGRVLKAWEVLAIGLTVLLASASAGAFNQYYEADLDRLMPRTRRRLFASGALRAGAGWLALIAAMLAAAVGAAAVALNPVSALHVFLGAFSYAVVYTVWLKRRSWLNIVIGGLAGSFAVLAGAAAVDPGIGALPASLALVLFLWTPSHFWCLAIAYRDEYVQAGVPMLPAVIGNERAARVILANTVALVAASFLPLLFGMGWVYSACALAGGGAFLVRNLALVRDPSRATAMRCFHASLAQLTLLLLGALADSALRG